LDSLSVADALSRHYEAHALPHDGGEGARWFHIRIGPGKLRLPNPPARKRAVLFHDVNHLVTGYDTAFSNGEMVIAGYELGSGCGSYWIAWLINLWMFALGLVLRPRPMFRAFLRGRRASSVYKREDRATLRDMTVAELRADLSVPQQVPPARLSDRVLFVLWSVAALAATLTPLILLVAASRGLF